MRPLSCALIGARSGYRERQVPYSEPQARWLVSLIKIPDEWIAHVTNQDPSQKSAELAPLEVWGENGCGFSVNSVIQHLNPNQRILLVAWEPVKGALPHGRWLGHPALLSAHSPAWFLSYSLSTLNTFLRFFLHRLTHQWHPPTHTRSLVLAKRARCPNQHNHLLPAGFL